MEIVKIDRKVIIDLAESIYGLQNKIESLELASDPELMESLRRSKEQIRNGELIEFSDL